MAAYDTFIAKEFKDVLEDEEMLTVIRDLTPGKAKYRSTYAKIKVSKDPKKYPEMLWVRLGRGQLIDSLRDYITLVRKRDLLLEVEEQVIREDIPELIERLSETKKVLLFKNLKGYRCSLVANLVPSHEVFRHLFNVENPYQFFLEGIKKTAKKVKERQNIKEYTTTKQAGIDNGLQK